MRPVMATQRQLFPCSWVHMRLILRLLFISYTLALLKWALGLAGALCPQLPALCTQSEAANYAHVLVGICFYENKVFVFGKSGSVAIPYMFCFVA